MEPSTPRSTAGEEAPFETLVDLDNEERAKLPGNPTTAMQADGYAQLLDRLGIDKVVVVGISAGAWSSMQFAVVIRNAAGRWCSSSPPTTCRRGRPSAAAPLSRRFSIPISSP